MLQAGAATLETIDSLRTASSVRLPPTEPRAVMSSHCLNNVHASGRGCGASPLQCLSSRLQAQHLDAACHKTDSSTVQNSLSDQIIRCRAPAMVMKLLCLSAPQVCGLSVAVFDGTRPMLGPCPALRILERSLDGGCTPSEVLGGVPEWLQHPGCDCRAAWNL